MPAQAESRRFSIKQHRRAQGSPTPTRKSLQTVAGKSSIFPGGLPPPRTPRACASAQQRLRADTPRCTIMLLFHPFYMILRQKYAEFRRGSRGRDENAVARQISLVFDDSLRGIVICYKKTSMLRKKYRFSIKIRKSP